MFSVPSATSRPHSSHDHGSYAGAGSTTRSGEARAGATDGGRSAVLDRGLVRAVREARATGVRAHAETCPHYIALTRERYDAPDFETVAGSVISPPLRAREDQDALWAGLADGTIDGFDLHTTGDHSYSASVRITKTEYVSCPSCGRTLFDLQTTTERIKSKTNHLKNVKIAIMGCIVNGPGEMADAAQYYSCAAHRAAETVVREARDALASATSEMRFAIGS